MSTWKTRASAASIMGACVFAVASGAGAVFVGDWWGQHHSPVVIQYVDGPVRTSGAATSHAASVQKVDAQTDAPPTQAPAAYPAEPDSAISQADPATRTSRATPHHTIKPHGSAQRTPSASGDGDGLDDAQRDPEHDADGHADPDRSVVVADASAVGVPAGRPRRGLNSTP